MNEVFSNIITTLGISQYNEMEPVTTNCIYIVLKQVNEISFTVNKFHEPLIPLLTVNLFVNGK